MELTGPIIRQAKEKSRAFSQITLDDDYIVKDSKPDVVKVIHSAGTIAVEEARLTGQSLRLSGRLMFWVLYQGDGERARPEVLEGEIPFQEKMVLEGAEDNDPVVLAQDVEDLTVGIINSRKLSIRAAAGFSAAVEEIKEEEIAEDAGSENHILQKQSKHTAADLLCAGKDVIRFRGEMMLPGTKPEIERLLWYEASLRGVEGTAFNGRIHVSGDLYINVLYLGGDDLKPAWVEKTLPFDEAVDTGIDPGGNPPLLWFCMRPENVEMQPEEDADGEHRILSVDVSYEIRYKIWSEKKCLVLEDAYAVDRKITLKKQPCSTLRFLMQNELTIRLKETIAVPQDREKILQIIGCTGKIVVDRETITDSGVRFEGILVVGILYLTSEDLFPIAYIESVLPFDETAEVAGIEPTSHFVYSSALDRLEVNLLDSSEYEVKAAIRIAVTAFSEGLFEKITALSEDSLSSEEIAAKPGITGIITREGDELWDIAKNCRTTPDAIRTENNLSPTADVLLPGTKLLVVKAMI